MYHWGLGSLTVSASTPVQYIAHSGAHRTGRHGHGRYSGNASYPIVHRRLKDRGKNTENLIDRGGYCEVHQGHVLFSRQCPCTAIEARTRPRHVESLTETPDSPTLGRCLQLPAARCVPGIWTGKAGVVLRTTSAVILNIRSFSKWKT